MHKSTEGVIVQEVLSAFLSSSAQHKRTGTPLPPVSLDDVVITVFSVTSVRYVIELLWYHFI